MLSINLTPSTYAATQITIFSFPCKDFIGLNVLEFNISQYSMDKPFCFW